MCIIFHRLQNSKRSLYKLETTVRSASRYSKYVSYDIALQLASDISINKGLAKSKPPTDLSGVKKKIGVVNRYIPALLLIWPLKSFVTEGTRKSGQRLDSLDAVLLHSMPIYLPA